MQDIPRHNYRLTDFRSLGGGKIRLCFINGVWVEIDFAERIAEGKIFPNLANDAYLAQGIIGDYGHWLEWPGELDFGADQLWWWGAPVEDGAARVNGIAVDGPAEPVAAR